MKNFFIPFFIISFLFQSCNKQSVQDDLKLQFDSLQVDFKRWYIYHNKNIVLSSNFKALDEQDNSISKEAFLKLLRTGEYITLKLEKTDDSETTYKLFKLNEASDETIIKSIKIFSAIAYAHFKFEGKKFPDFHFRTIEGTNYTNENIKGNLLIVKCWFINCKPCIAEFPELNDLVDSYQHENNVIFLSLALDDHVSLKTFFKNKTFNYETVASQESFIKDSLKVIGFPTHFIVDKNGYVVKMLNNVSELKNNLDIQIAANNSDIITRDKYLESPPPPPPPPIK